MSEQNVEVVRRHMAAYLDTDPERALAFLDPDVELDASVRPDGRVWKGHAGIRRAMTEWTGTWDDCEVEIERYVDAGADRCCTCGTSGAAASAAALRWISAGRRS
jgi:ketosteroid isomerase-like protein